MSDGAVLVTGGAGYIGSHAAKALHQAGHQVVVFDNLIAGHRAAVKYGELVEGDITDVAAVRLALREHQVKAVMHFAAFLDVGESVREPAKYYRNNVVGAQVIASQAQVQANEVALNGVREEARVGQRTTLDVLNAQQELLNARVNLIVAQRNRVVFSYGVVQAIGRLTARYTALPVATYSAKTHYDQVKDLWYGVRTTDGR